MSLESLQERLSALQETTAHLRELIDRLANLDFQPGSVPQGTDEESSVSGELSAEIGQGLRTGLEEQELLKEEVKFVRPEGEDKASLKEGIDRLGTELISCRSDFRRARISARDSLARAQKLERQLLLQSYSVAVSEPDISNNEAEQDIPVPVYRPQKQIHQPHHQQSTLTDEDQRTVGASNDVTNALRRTHDLIAAELYRSEYAHQTLTESSAALKQLNESYSSLDTMLASSKDLLGTLLRSQKSDTWYLQTALYMLMVTGAWLLFRRLLYGPMWWLVWLPLRVVFGVGSKAGSAVMQRSAPGGSGKADVNGMDGRATVEGLPKDVPTAQVGQKPVDSDDPDSMIEKVKKVVDAANEAETLAHVDIEEADPEGQPRNPKKRMWDEQEVVGGESQQHDEL